MHRASALRDRVRGGGAAQIRHRQRGPLRASRGCAGRPRVFRRVSNLKTSDDHMEMHEEAEAGVNDDGGKEDVRHDSVDRTRSLLGHNGSFMRRATRPLASPTSRLPACLPSRVKLYSVPILLLDDNSLSEKQKREISLCTSHVTYCMKLLL